MSGECWLAVPGYEGIYAVSDHGRIMSFWNRGKMFLKPNLDTRGYPMVALSDGKSRRYEAIHRIVARTFLGDRPTGLEINHIDGVKTNNSVSNLEYVSRTQNIRHAVDKGLHVSLKGESHYYSVFTNEQVLEIRRKYRPRAYPYSKLAKEYGASLYAIYAVVKRITWKHI